MTFGVHFSQGSSYTGAMDDVYCEFPEFESFLTEQERIDVAYEGCAYSDYNEDQDRYAEQDEDTSRFLLEVLS